MPDHTPITAYAVRTSAGITLKLDHGAALQYAADHHGTVHPLIEHTPAMGAAEVNHLTLALRQANRAVIADIESEGVRCLIDGTPHYDIRPMLDLHEHSPEAIDIAHESLAYATFAGLATPHPQQPHMLRINRPAGL